MKSTHLHCIIGQKSQLIKNSTYLCRTCSNAHIYTHVFVLYAFVLYVVVLDVFGTIFYRAEDKNVFHGWVNFA